MAELRIELPGGSDAPARARHEVKRGLAAALGDDELMHLELLISELVTNAVRHGGMAREGDRIEVRVRAEAEGLRVEVLDGGSGFVPGKPQPRSFEDGGGGLGLVLLDRLATEWGVINDGRVCVWAEIPRLPTQDDNQERAA